MTTAVAEENDVDNDVEKVEDETAVGVKDVIAEWKLDSEQLVEIRKVNVKLKEAKAEMESRKIEYNEARAIHEKLAVKVSESIDPPDMPLFDQAETPEASNDEPGPEAWACVGIEVIELDKTTEAILIGYGLTCMGDIASFAEDGKHFGDIKGIGQAKVEQITLALDAYWEANPLPEKEIDKSDPEGWRNAEIGKLPMSMHIQGLLQGEGIDCLGELSTHITAKTLVSIDGIGDATVQDLNVKLNDYVADWGGKPETEAK